jgi:uncharacterized membrane protein
MILSNVMLALHLLGSVVWVGGMVFAALVFRRVVAPLEPAQRLALHRAAFGRFFLLVWHAMPITIASGLWLLFGHYGGFASVPWSIHAMLLLGLVMAGVFLAIVFGPWPAMRGALDAGDMPGAGAAAARIRLLVNVNLLLGLVTVALGGAARYG